MNEALVAALVVAALITSAVLLVRLRQALAPAAGDERGLPRYLVGAELAYAEQTFRSRQRGLVAKLDRAYRVDGELQLMELKTRRRDVVYMSDVIEMSVQRIALEDDTNQTVSNQAWVVVQTAGNGDRRAHRIRLLSERQIDDMRQRYQEIIVGKVERPEPSRSAHQCASCGHRERCKATFHDR
jgi:CRISPR-associated exonuclease Cas4